MQLWDLGAAWQGTVLQQTWGLVLWLPLGGSLLFWFIWVLL